MARIPQEGAPFRPLVRSLDAESQWLPELRQKIESCDAAWFLGGCILGFAAPCCTYPLSQEEYQLQAWLLFERIFPDQARRLLEVMKDNTGFDLNKTRTVKPVVQGPTVIPPSGPDQKERPVNHFKILKDGDWCYFIVPEGYDKPYMNGFYSNGVVSAETNNSALVKIEAKEFDEALSKSWIANESAENLSDTP